MDAGGGREEPCAAALRVWVISTQWEPCATSSFAILAHEPRVLVLGGGNVSNCGLQVKIQKSLFHWFKLSTFSRIPCTGRWQGMNRNFSRALFEAGLVVVDQILE